MKFIIFAIPVFFLLIGVELIVARLRKTDLYRFNDAVTNISCGLSSRIFGVVLKTFIYIGYFFLWENYSLFDIPQVWWTYALLFVGVDFFYYWFHRYSHEVSVFWGTHIVHHQSEEYNLSVALRQSSLQPIISNLFYLPLALLGFHPFAFIAMNAFQTLYQFWIHTKLIGKMHPAIEFVFNTPSHHRVHHGINPKYIDKNHGGTFIVFDRMFGTFQTEEEEVVYGTVKPLSTWNPLWANLDYYSTLAKEMRQTTTFKDKLLMLVKKPGWRPAYLGGPHVVPPVKPEERQKFNPQVSPHLNHYVMAQYLVIFVGAGLFLISAESLTLLQIVVGNVLFFWSLANLGVFLDGKNWAFPLELLRLLLVPGIIFGLMWGMEYQLLLTGIAVLLNLAALVWLGVGRRRAVVVD